MRPIPPIVAVLASAFIVASCAGSSNPGPRMPMASNQQIAPPIGLMFAGLDADRDAVISREEIAAALPLMFEAHDSDSSGALTGVEFSDWSTKHLGNSHAVPGRLRFDINQNNRISMDEFESTIEALVMRFDRNNDGALARDELLMTISGPDMGAMRSQMEAQMRARARQMCQRARR